MVIAIRPGLQEVLMAIDAGGVIRADQFEVLEGTLREVDEDADGAKDGIVARINTARVLAAEGRVAEVNEVLEPILPTLHAIFRRFTERSGDSDLRIRLFEPANQARRKAVEALTASGAVATKVGIDKMLEDMQNIILRELLKKLIEAANLLSTDKQAIGHPRYELEQFNIEGVSASDASIIVRLLYSILENVHLTPFQGARISKLIAQALSRVNSAERDFFAEQVIRDVGHLLLKKVRVQLITLLMEMLTLVSTDVYRKRILDHVVVEITSFPNHPLAIASWVNGISQYSNLLRPEEVNTITDRLLIDSLDHRLIYNEDELPKRTIQKIKLTPAPNFHTRSFHVRIALSHFISSLPEPESRHILEDKIMSSPLWAEYISDTSEPSLENFLEWLKPPD